MADKDIKYTITAEDRFARTFASLKKDLATARDGFGSTLDVATKLNAGLGLVAFGAAAVGGGIGLGLRNLAKDIDALNDSSDAIGDTVENLSGLEDVARRNGESLDLVTSSLIKMNQTLAAAKKDSPAAIALKAIGLEASALRSMAPADALTQIARALSGYADDGNKARIVQELFGKSLKEVAPYLKDLADAGARNVTVTREQAAEAERFNKHLSVLATEANNAGRSLVGNLIPSINEAFARTKDLRELFGGFASGIGSLALSSPFSISDSDLEKQRKQRSEIEKLETSIKRLQDVQAQGGGLSLADTITRQQADLQAARRRMEFLNRAQAREALASAGSDLDERRFRPKQSVLPDLTNAGGKVQVSEAQRYLESLQRQGEKLQELSQYEQVLLDIQKGRIDGLTPALERQIKATARQVDLDKQAIELRDSQVASQTAVARAALDNVAAIDENNRALQAEIQTISLTPAALVDVELARIRSTIALRQQTIAEREAAGVGDERLQVLNAEIEALKKRAGLLVDKVDAEGKKAARDAADIVAVDTKTDLADSIAQGILEGTRSGRSIFDTFRKEIEAQFAKTILRPMISPVVEAGNKLLEGVFSSLAGAFFNTTPSGYDYRGTVLPDILRGGKANGGGARAGHRLTVNENGTETFIPATDGVILSGSQTAAMKGGVTNNYYNSQVVVQGDASERTLGLINAAIARNNQQLSRSRATGGAWADR
jgi:hypothetical protein